MNPERALTVLSAIKDNPEAVAALDSLVAELQDQGALRTELAAMEERKDGAYYERNQVVAALAHAFPSGIARTAIEGWDECWHGCVYIDLPTGQASWHYHDSHGHLFEHLPPYTKRWDGHTTEEKYARLAQLSNYPSENALNTPRVLARRLAAASDMLLDAADTMDKFSRGVMNPDGAWVDQQGDIVTVHSPRLRIEPPLLEGQLSAHTPEIGGYTFRSHGSTPLFEDTRLDAAVRWHNGVWPDELESGVMFHCGLRIERATFEAHAAALFSASGRR